ncbi:hypothetical protein ACOMHN_030727 [Nucella lapillus]
MTCQLYPGPNATSQAIGSQGTARFVHNERGDLTLQYTYPDPSGVDSVGIALTKVADLEVELPLAQVQGAGLVVWSWVEAVDISHSLFHCQSLIQTLVAPSDAMEVVVDPGQEQSVEG